MNEVSCQRSHWPVVDTYRLSYDPSPELDAETPVDPLKQAVGYLFPFSVTLDVHDDDYQAFKPPDEVDDDDDDDDVHEHKEQTLVKSHLRPNQIIPLIRLIVKEHLHIKTPNRNSTNKSSVKPSKMIKRVTGVIV